MNKYMKMAIREAKKGIAAGHGGPFGAVITKDGKIISKGHNKVLINNDPTCHGEIDAIRKACKKLKTFDLTGCELYTTGEPCPMCLSAIIWANIKTVYYGCNAKDTEIIGFRDDFIYNYILDYIKNGYDANILAVKELDRINCLKLYKEYNNIKDKTLY